MNKATRLKAYTDGNPVPRDFWNYNMNPISGLSLREQSEDDEEVAKKYFISSNGDLNDN